MRVCSKSGADCRYLRPPGFRLFPHRLFPVRTEFSDVGSMRNRTCSDDLPRDVSLRFSRVPCEIEPIERRMPQSGHEFSRNAPHPARTGAPYSNQCVARSGSGHRRHSIVQWPCAPSKNFLFGLRPFDIQRGCPPSLTKGPTIGPPNSYPSQGNRS